MLGTSDDDDRKKKRKKRNPKKQRSQHEGLIHQDPAFDPARELGRQLARGAAFSAGKKLADVVVRDLDKNPDGNILSRLLEWIQSL